MPVDGVNSSTTLSGRLRFGGLASGLDTNALIETLMVIEAQPLNRMEAEKADVENQQRLFRELNTKLLTLRDSARDLDNRTSTLGSTSLEEEFLAFSTTSTDEDTLTASADGDATPANYEITIDQLATVGREISTGQADATASLGFGGETLTIDYGGDDDIEINFAASTSLASLRSLINDDANNDGSVSATIIDDGTDSHLIISGTNTGADNDIVITETAGMAGFIDAAAAITAQDAQLSVLGLDVTRSSNTIDDVITGVTLELHDDPGTSVEIEVAMDTTTIASNLTTFIDAYNDVRSFIRTNTKFDAENNTTGPLAGDSTIRFVDSLITSTVTRNFDTFSQANTYTGLSQIGISTNASGLLTLDEEVLEEALTEDSAAVKQLLRGDEDGGDNEDLDGVMVAVARALEPLTRIGDGLMTVRDDGFDTRIESIDLRIEQFTRFLEIREERLIRRFSGLESTITGLQAQEAFLSALR